MKKDINNSKRRSGRRNNDTSERKETTVSGSNGLAQLDAARLGYVATLPMGRPLLTAIEEGNANYDARGLSRPTVILQDVALNYYGMFTQPEDHPWLTRAAIRIMARLRAEVRSNTNYTEDDIKVYLIQALSVYTHGVVIKRMLQTTTLYDTRAPLLSRELNAAYGNIALDATIGTIPTIATQATIQANSGNTVPPWIADDSLGSSWLDSTKLEGALAMYMLPSEVKALIDYYFGQVHVKDTDSQYYAMRIIPETSGYLRYVTDHYSWLSMDLNSPASAAGSSKYLAQNWERGATDFFTGAPVRMSTLAADLRRLSGWEACFLDMPPELGGSPNISADDKYFTTMMNAYHLETDLVNTLYNFSGVQEDYAAPPMREEVRVNMRSYSFSDPIAVGVALLMCDVQRSAGERSHTMWTVRSETMYGETEGGSGAYLSMTQIPLLGCGYLVPDNGNYVFPIIGAGGVGPEKVSWAALAAIQADTLCPRIDIIFTGPTDEATDRPFRSIIENGADLTNGTRVSFDNVLDVIETFYETLFVK